LDAARPQMKSKSHQLLSYHLAGPKRTEKRLRVPKVNGLADVELMRRHWREGPNDATANTS
jgi:hypothetical protein